MHRRPFVTARSLLAACFVLCSVATVLADEGTISPEHEEFFETRIRPLLVDSCQECHSRDYAEAGVQLDSRAALVGGGESGQMVIPGNPDGSRLIEVVMYNRDVQMPPDEKLKDDQIADLRRWVELGLPWPAGDDDEPLTEEDPGTSSVDESPYERIARQHWAFQPVVQPAVPAVQDQHWAQGDLDRFVLARLEAQGLTPSPPADKQTLIRRATFDLIGLPPTYEEVQAFLADDSPEAFARVIDRLLASPHYGERWGRHWLDVARYADTKGYVFTAEPKYPYSYTYRDYVVNSFNEDKPFDQFIVEQLAADKLELGEDKEPLAALGFLTLGRRFNNNIHDIIDDRIDVVTRGLMGVSVSCARCHDHKYDPIPTADYYSLYGIFASCHEPEEHPLIGDPQDSDAYDQFMAELNKRQQELDGYLATQLVEVQQELRTNVAAYLVHIAGASVDQNSPNAALSLGKGEVKPQVARRWRQKLEQSAQGHDPVFAPWHVLVSAGDNFADRLHQLMTQLELQAHPETALAATTGPESGPTAETPPLVTGDVNRLVHEAIATKRPTNNVELAAVYGELFSEIHNQWTAAVQAASEQMAEAPVALPDPAAEQLRQVLMAEGAPTTIKQDQLIPLLNRAQQNRRRNLQAAIDSHKANSVGAPPRAMVLLDSATPHQPHIFLRGNPARPGEAVPRQFLSVLNPTEREPYQQGSGRLELAREIASADNPLTSRVIVNRVWQQHFGFGLVRTSSDFGTRGELPTHPELLDYLAQRFTDQGWSVKQLHREIMLSARYQQQSANRPDCAAVDPENRLLWRMNRRRLEFEPLRDSLLAVSGELDRQLGGRPVDLFTEAGTPRRSIYGFIDRQDLPGVFRAFNLASPDASSPDRPQTTVPQQALYVMNSPFVIAQAKSLAARATNLAPDDAAQSRIARLYELALSRPATEAEITLSTKFLAAPAAEDSQLSRWEQLAQVLLLTNEFAFVD